MFDCLNWETKDRRSGKAGCGDGKKCLVKCMSSRLFPRCNIHTHTWSCIITEAFFNHRGFLQRANHPSADIKLVGLVG